MNERDDNLCIMCFFNENDVLISTEHWFGHYNIALLYECIDMDLFCTYMSNKTAVKCWAESLYPSRSFPGFNQLILFFLQIMQNAFIWQRNISMSKAINVQLPLSFVITSWLTVRNIRTEDFHSRRRTYSCYSSELNFLHNIRIKLN